MSLRSSRCAFSTAAALHRVFIAPIERSQFALQRHQASALPQTSTSKLHAHTQYRSYAASPATKRRLPRNKEITSTFVRLVTEDGKLSAPQTTWGVLNQLDPTTHSLITVSQPANPRSPAAQDDSEWGAAEVSASSEQEWPICKIMGNKELWEHERTKTKKTKAPAQKVKTIELNWAIDGNDLNHRLDRIREFLEKGYRVEVMMAGKRKGRKATQEEAEALVRSVKSVVDEVPGAKEMKDMDGKVLGQATLYFEGKIQKKEHE